LPWQGKGGDEFNCLIKTLELVVISKQILFYKIILDNTVSN
jgi:hypothetical protein